jgi:hypothetical protein
VLQDVSVGPECSAHKEHLELTYPMKNGIVQSWDDMKLIWDHAFYEQLKVGSAMHAQQLVAASSASAHGARGRCTVTPSAAARTSFSAPHDACKLRCCLHSPLSG